MLCSFNISITFLQYSCSQVADFAFVDLLPKEIIIFSLENKQTNNSCPQKNPVLFKTRFEQLVKKLQ